MYKLNYEEDRITAKGSFESNEELWKQKIKQVKVYGTRKNEGELKKFCSALEENRINYGTLRNCFEEIETVDIALNSYSGAGSDELGAAAMEAISETNSPVVKVSLDNKSYDEIFYEDGNVRLEIDGNMLEINGGKITFSGYADDLKDMAEYLNEVEEFLLPENREALHQIESAQKNARKR